jgi:hypothetical protein
MRYLCLVRLATSVGACGAQQGQVGASSRDSSSPALATGRQVALQQSGEDSVVTRIRTHFALIERERPSYRCRTLPLAGFSTEGGGLEACYAGNRLRKLTAIYLGESGRGQEEYYFWNDSLEFLLRKTSHYSEPLSGKVVSTDEDRFYWNSDRLVRWVNPQQRSQTLTTSEAAGQDRDARATALKLATCAANLADSLCAA